MSTENTPRLVGIAAVVTSLFTAGYQFNKAEIAELKSELNVKLTEVRHAEQKRKNAEETRLLDANKHALNEQITILRQLVESTREEHRNVTDELAATKDRSAKEREEWTKLVAALDQVRKKVFVTIYVPEGDAAAQARGRAIHKGIHEISGVEVAGLITVKHGRSFEILQSSSVNKIISNQIRGVANTVLKMEASVPASLSSPLQLVEIWLGATAQSPSAAAPLAPPAPPAAPPAVTPPPAPAPTVVAAPPPTPIEPPHHGVASAEPAAPNQPVTLEWKNKRIKPGRDYEMGAGWQLRMTRMTRISASFAITPPRSKAREIDDVQEGKHRDLDLPDGSRYQITLEAVDTLSSKVSFKQIKAPNARPPR